MSLIKMDYSEVMAEANKFFELARQGSSCSQQANRLANQVPSCWAGESGNMFSNLCKQLEREFHDLSNRLDVIGNNLKTVAREIREAEQRAKRAAEACK